MKCDELKRFDIVGKYRDEETMYEFRPDGECYDADEVDAGIAELKAENERLKEERRWRKFSEEKPKEKQWILVYYGYENNGCRINLRRWDDGCQYDVEFQEIYTHWMPLPYAPKDEFKSNNEVNNA